MFRAFSASPVTSRPAATTNEALQLNLVSTMKLDPLDATSVASGACNAVQLAEYEQWTLNVQFVRRSDVAALAAPFSFLVLTAPPEAGKANDWVWASGSNFVVFHSLLALTPSAVSISADPIYSAATPSGDTEEFKPPAHGVSFPVPDFFMVPTGQLAITVAQHAAHYVASRSTGPVQALLPPLPATPGTTLPISIVSPLLAPPKASYNLVECRDKRLWSVPVKGEAAFARVKTCSLLMRVMARDKFELLVPELDLDMAEVKKRLSDFVFEAAHSTVLPSMLSLAKWPGIQPLKVSVKDCSQFVAAFTGTGYVSLDQSALCLRHFGRLPWKPLERKCSSLGRLQIADCLAGIAECWSVWWDHGFAVVFAPVINLLAQANTPFRDFEDVYIATVLWQVIGSVCRHLRDSPTCPLVQPVMPMSTPVEVQALFFAYLTAQMKDVVDMKGKWDSHSPHKRWFEEEDGTFIRLIHDAGSHKSPRFMITGSDKGGEAKPDKPKGDEKKGEDKSDKRGPKRNRDGVLVNAYGAPLRDDDRKVRGRNEDRGRAEYKDDRGRDDRGRDDKGDGRRDDRRDVKREGDKTPSPSMEPLAVRQAQHCPFFTMGCCNRQSSKGGRMTCADPCPSDRIHANPKDGTRAECIAGLEAVGILSQRAFVAHAKAMARGFFKGE